MPCPRCQSSHISEEYKLTVCTDCGYVLDDSRLREEGPQLTPPGDASANAVEGRDGTAGELSGRA